MAYRRCGFRYEKKLRITGVSRIAGIDEAGRGALAGPVVAAAAILPEKFRHRRLNDSKQLLPERREEIYRELTSNSAIVWAVGIVDSVEIDEINILRATHKAMRAAIADLEAHGPCPIHRRSFEPVAQPLLAFECLASRRFEDNALDPSDFCWPS